MWYKRPLTEKEIKDVIDVFYQFPYKEITMEMLMEARRKTALGYATIKKILHEHINDMNNTYGKNKL